MPTSKTLRYRYEDTCHSTIASYRPHRTDRTAIHSVANSLALQTSNRQHLRELFEKKMNGPKSKDLRMSLLRFIKRFTKAPVTDPLECERTVNMFISSVRAGAQQESERAAVSLSHPCRLRPT